MTAFHRNGRVLTALVLVLVACDGKDERNLAALDAELVNNTADSAIREAIEAPLATDPQLGGDSQRNAVRPAPRPLNGAVQVLSLTKSEPGAPPPGTSYDMPLSRWLQSPITIGEISVRGSVV